jgi:hypothetical protein
MYQALESDTANPRAGLYVEFFPGKRMNEFRSKETGKPEYDLIDFIKKCNPGDPTNVIERPARDEDKDEFPGQWAAYQRRTSYRPESGTPIEDWPRLDVATVAKLKALEFHTVEQLAECSDQQCQRIGMGCYDLRTKAAAYIAAAKDTALAQRQAEEITLRNQEIADLKGANARLCARLEALESLRQEGETEKRGPGRPRKAETE